MVMGTGSDAGKSLTVAALCRILRQDGFNVAPFKAQNMALNSFATIEGHEIGRAQAMQAQAAGIEPHVDMNPILLKPTSDNSSQVILKGNVLGNFRGIDYYALKTPLLEVVSAAYERLASRHDIIVLEGAGSPVEINLKHCDVVNLRMAELADASCVLVADIDRGGVFASLVGTYSLLEPVERARFCGFLINKFRGDVDLFTSGIEFLEKKLVQPCLGVIPYLRDHGIDDEDAASCERRAARPPLPSRAQLGVCVVPFPYLANFTDFTALEQQPNVVVYYARDPDEARCADVLILPGSKNTISDLLWLKSNGWRTAIENHVAAGKPLLGICGGFQMLGRAIRDPYRAESEIEATDGLSILNVETSLAREKTTRQVSANLYDNSVLHTNTNPQFSGYEIHLGETSLREGVQPLFRFQRAGDPAVRYDGAVGHDGRVLGTYLHGLFDSAEGLVWILNHWLRMCGKDLVQEVVDPAGERERRYDALADHFRRHLNLDLIYRTLEERRR
jgi:adenosylcobyric acid synthase